MRRMESRKYGTFSKNCAKKQITVKMPEFSINKFYCIFSFFRKTERIYRKTYANIWVRTFGNFDLVITGYFSFSGMMRTVFSCTVSEKRHKRLLAENWKKLSGEKKILFTERRCQLMRTWDDYKSHIKKEDPKGAEYVGEAEAVAEEAAE